MRVPVSVLCVEHMFSEYLYLCVNVWCVRACLRVPVSILCIEHVLSEYLYLCVYVCCGVRACMYACTCLRSAC